MKVNLTESEITFLKHIIENNLETSIEYNPGCHFEIDEIKRLTKNLNKKLVFKKLKYGELHPRLARMRTSLRGL